MEGRSRCGIDALERCQCPAVAREQRTERRGITGEKQSAHEHSAACECCICGTCHAALSFTTITAMVVENLVCFVRLLQSP